MLDVSKVHVVVYIRPNFELEFFSFSGFNAIKAANIVQIPV